jgi:ABC-2 type transport system permease protein
MIRAVSAACLHPRRGLKGARKYWAILTTQVINSAAYPGDLAARSLTMIVFMWVFTQLWGAAYRITGTSAIGGLTLRETLWYLMMAETIELSKPRVTQTIADAVKDGSVAYLLNKPYDFLLYHAAVSFGDSLLRMVFNVLAGGALIWLSAGAPPDARGWPLVLVTVLLAWLLHFCLNAVIGLAAFVTEDVAAFEWIYQKLVMILGGLLIPLDFFPAWLRDIAQALPFAYTLYGPARLFVDPSLERFGALFAGQALWLLVLGGALMLAYRRGVARLTINGG